LNSSYHTNKRLADSSIAESSIAESSIAKSTIAVATIAELVKYSDEERALSMRAYMKDNFVFLGVQSKLRLECIREVLKSYKLASLSNFRHEIEILWLDVNRESQYAAQDLYRKRIKHESADAIDFLQWMLTTKPWWDTVDFIASNLVGPLALKYPEIKQSHLKPWITSENLWLRRTSIIYQLKYKNSVDEVFLQEAIKVNVEDKDFFIRKAIGWALRQYSKFNPDFVKDILAIYPLSNLSRKEASKYI